MGEHKHKLGVVFFTARWFEEVALGKDEQSREFNEFLKLETQKIINELSDKMTVVSMSVVTSMDKAWNAVKMLLSEDFDAVLFCFVVWAEDEYLLPFKDVMKIKPSIIWAYVPYKKPPGKSNVMTLFRNSGIVGSFQGFGVLKRMETSPFYVFGSSNDKEPYEKIEKIARAANVYKMLKKTRLGILPYRNDQMIVTYVDELELYSRIGPLVEYISVLQLKNAADSIPDSAVEEYVEKVKSDFNIDERITEDNLRKSARASLGMEKIIYDREIDGLALSDLNPELHEVMGLRPCLYPDRLALSNKVVGNEGDLGCTTAMVILQRLTGKPVMIAEIFNYDIEDNIINAGHAGPSNYLIAGGNEKVNIVPDYELMDSTSEITGVWMEFIGKPGRVTIVNFISTKAGFQMTVLGGESIGGEPRIEGYPHCSIRIDPDIMDFIKSNAENGVSHHWAVVHDDVREELSYLADMLGIKKIVLW